ncbi:proteasome assembly chaperone 1 isoform X1 [Athalia rosae]|uniref:proteasome assembly chaperone 1 isoform X1 n=2 Tax=Athalia rosae TaxID=37344 RepID=UPI0020331FB2|nr:proteasome assembly chaperone 1 isoform X1 [Athalia rosae]
MAHFFGEVIEPDSRSFWDIEEVDAAHFTYSLQWVGDNTMPTKIKTLIIVEGREATDFTRQCSLKDTKEICIIDHGKFKPSFIYKMSSNPDLYVFLVGPELNAKHATEFTLAIKDFLFAAGEIITINCQHISSYKCDPNTLASSTSFLRRLSTRNSTVLWKEVERIKQPNILHGIVAAVMSYAEFMVLPATAYILYVEDFSLDSQTALPLIELFSRITGGTLHKTVFKPSSFSIAGNLYM